MPHIIVEYTDNLKKEAHIPELLKKINAGILKYPDIIPIGGLRTRAIELKDFIVADGKEDDAFVHVTLKIAKGRTNEQKELIGEELFSIIKNHLDHIFKKRYLAISMEIYEFQNKTYKLNNIHQRYSKE